MPIEKKRVTTTIDAGLRRAGSLDDVLGVLVGALGDDFSLCRVSLRVVLPETAEVEILAVWAVRRTGLSPGTRMPLRSTSLAEVVATGRPQVGSNVQAGDGLLHQLLAEEGIRSYASAALGDVAHGAPVLSMSSNRPDGFLESDLPLVEAIAGVVAPHVARLLPPPR